MNFGKLLFISLALSMLALAHCRPQYGEYDFEPREFPPPANMKRGNPADPGIWWAQRLFAGGAVSLKLLLWFRAYRREAIPRMADVTHLISQFLTKHDRNRPCMERCLRNKVSWNLQISYEVAFSICGSEICGLDAQFLAQMVESIPSTLDLGRDSQQRIEDIQNEQAEAAAAQQEPGQNLDNGLGQPTEGSTNREYRASPPVPPPGARMTVTKSSAAGQSLFDGLKAGIKKPSTLGLAASVKQFMAPAQAGRNAGFRKVGFRLPVRAR